MSYGLIQLVYDTIVCDLIYDTYMALINSSVVYGYRYIAWYN